MKILVTSGIGSEQFIRLGWTNALNKLEHTAFTWNHRVIPAFDIFAEFKPQLLMCGVPDLSVRAIRKCIYNSPQLKIVVFKRNEREEFELAEKAPLVLLQKAAYDSIADKPTQADPRLECDLIYVGSFSNDKEEKIMQYLPILCKNFKTKIFGFGHWPLIQHLGVLSRNLASTAYLSAKASLSLGNNQERIFRILGSGGKAVVEHTEISEKIFKDSVDYFNTPKTCCEAVQRAIDRKPKPVDLITYLDLAKDLTRSLSAL